MSRCQRLGRRLLLDRLWRLNLQHGRMLSGHDRIKRWILCTVIPADLVAAARRTRRTINKSSRGSTTPIIGTLESDLTLVEKASLKISAKRPNSLPTRAHQPRLNFSSCRQVHNFRHCRKYQIGLESIVAPSLNEVGLMFVYRALITWRSGSLRPGSLDRLRNIDDADGRYEYALLRSRRRFCN